LASNLPPVRELCLNPKALLEPGDEGSWRKGIEDILRERKPLQLFYCGKIQSVEEMAKEVLEVYRSELGGMELS